MPTAKNMLATNRANLNRPDWTVPIDDAARYNAEGWPVFRAGLSYTPDGVVSAQGKITNINAGTKYYIDAAGTVRIATANQAGGYVHHVHAGSGLFRPVGVRWEPAVTNAVAADAQRDLTHADWVKTNVTAARDQVGADGSANTGTKLTATAGNGTAVLTVTHASALRAIGIMLKRITGTGNVDISLDSSTWVTVTLRSDVYLRFDTSLTAANTQIAIRIVTSGDVIAADFATHVAGSAAGSFATGARTADTASISSAFLTPIKAAGKITVKYTPSAATAGAARTFVDTRTGATGFLFAINSSAQLSVLWENVSRASTGLTWTPGTTYECSLEWSGATITLKRDGVAVYGPTAQASAMTTLNATAYLGQQTTGVGQADGAVSLIEAVPA